jgi:hypothetical protein
VVCGGWRRVPGAACHTSPWRRGGAGQAGGGGGVAFIGMDTPDLPAAEPARALACLAEGLLSLCLPRARLYGESLQENTWQ